MGGRGFTPAVFVDDSRVLQGSVINGIEVRSPVELPSLVQDLEITRVLLAVPSVSRRRRQKILKRLESLAIRVQTMPDISDLISGRARVDEIQEVDVADLLGRDPVPPNEKLLDACIRGKNVMVTGAGGSIGAELCRQIIELSPQRLLLFELSELALYTVHKELCLIAEREGLGVEIVPLIGSVHHRNRVREILDCFAIDTVYHAAAYKHVPIVEENMVEGIYNNVYGTWNAAEAALQSGVETFVLVSTDKAVSPPNVMGATKRMAELVLQGMHERGSGTRFCMVRFGNVLASSGSVVPLFRDQIKRGGPVTVTHPEIIRYFMTIPEAAQLVLQAGSMAKGGDVFVLDMGKPVRIADLARRMIHLMGLSVRDDDNPDGDIEVLYTGLRPAEKLYEELLIGDNVAGTEHPRIMRAVEDCMPWHDIEVLLDQLLKACEAFDCESARGLLRQAVAGYRPSSSIRDLVHDRSSSNPAAAGSGKVTPIAAGRVSE
jgi:FlaA1/EpsC-like NDP-sugar epimerase